MHNDVKFDDACRMLEAFEPDQAEPLLREILETEPNRADVLNKIGVAFAQRKQLFEAENYFRLALEKDEYCAAALVNLGNLCQEAGDYVKALTFYEDAIKKDLDYPMSYYNKAIILKKNGDYKGYTSFMKQYKRLLRRQHADGENSARIIAKRRMGCLPAMILIAVSIVSLMIFIQ